MPARRGGAKDKALTKTQLVGVLADKTGLSKSQINALFDTLVDVVAKEIKAGRAVALFGLAKIVVKHKKATPQRTGINNLTKEKTVFKAKPARSVVKVKPLKTLKEMV